VFGSIEQDLLLNKKVLFSGTPCQVDAVNRYLDIKKTSKDNLFTVDIICHGVPSSKVFDEFILYLNKEFKSNVVLYKFRYKPISWRGNSCFAELENGKKIFDNKKLNVFMNLYYSSNITRESCYNCLYTTKERVSDLTISDYWGIEEVNKEFEDKLGVSMVIVNTTKGKNIFNKTQGDKVLTGEYPKKQPQLSTPQERPKTREEFWADFGKSDMKHIAKKYGGVKRPNLKSILHKIIK
jgi:coenzyme F420-reducing hydrogenase beta subunit